MEEEGRRALLGTVTMIMAKLSIGTVLNDSRRTVPIHDIYIVVQRHSTVDMIMSTLNIGTVLEGSRRKAPIHNMYIIVLQLAPRFRDPWKWQQHQQQAASSKQQA